MHYDCLILYLSSYCRLEQVALALAEEASRREEEASRKEEEQRIALEMEARLQAEKEEMERVLAEEKNARMLAEAKLQVRKNIFFSK